MRSSAPTPRAKSQIRPRRCYSMLSMMPDLLGQANQRQTTRRGWRCGGPRPGWQLNQAHDLCQTISRVCCTPRLSSSRSERTTGRSWCCNVTRALDASWNALSLGFGGAQFLHRASDNVLPMIARQWLFMHFWWHWDSNCPPSRRSSSFQRCSKPRWIHDVPVKYVPHHAIWPARTSAESLVPTSCPPTPRTSLAQSASSP